MTSSGKDGKAKLRIEVMIECGLKPKVVQDHKVADGISAMRQIFPRLHFDTRCEEAGGLECLRQYQTEWDDDLKTFKKTALANWAAHGADAARYMAVAFRDLRQEPVKTPGRMFSMNPTTLPTGVPGVTLNDLWANRPKASRRI